MVVLTKDNQVLLVRQYRAAVDDVVYDFPAGFVENDGQSLLAQAQRELREETGYEAAEWFALGKAYALPNRSNKVNYLFLALNAEKVGAQQLDATEFVNYQLVPLQKLEQMIASGEFNCGVCMASFLRARIKLDEIARTTA